MTVAMLQRVVDEANRLVGSMTAEDLNKPSPCEGWAVRDVVNHITGGATMFAVSAEQGSVPDEILAQIGGDMLGADPAGALQAASRRAIKAFEEPGVMDKVVTLPFGQMPAGVALNIAIFDVATHCGDLSRGSGRPVTDTEMFDIALPMAKEMLGPELRQPGLFGPEQPAPAGASALEQLMAFTGRMP